MRMAENTADIKRLLHKNEMAKDLVRVGQYVAETLADTETALALLDELKEQQAWGFLLATNEQKGIVWDEYIKLRGGAELDRLALVRMGIVQRMTNQPLVGFEFNITRTYLYGFIAFSRAGRYAWVTRSLFNIEQKASFDYEGWAYSAKVINDNCGCGNG